MRIPFDSLVLAIVCAEARAAVGSTVRKVTQRDPTTITLRLSGPEFDGALTLSCDPNAYRMHLASAVGTVVKAEHFARMLREKVEGGRVLEISQHGFDRVCHIRIRKSDGEHVLAAHFTGTHANLLLVSPEGKLVAKCRKVGKEKLGARYTAPSAPATGLIEAVEKDRGLSSFLKMQIAELGKDRVMQLAKSGPRALIIGKGAYAFLPAGEDGAKQMASLSLALEQHFAVAASESSRANKVSTLRGQLGRARTSIARALSRMRSAIDGAARAGELQNQGELLLAFGSSLEPGADHLDVNDGEGNQVRIELDPTKNYVENAECLFRKAKRAKHAAIGLAEALEAKKRDLFGIDALIESLKDADDRLVHEIELTAKSRGWLREAALPQRGKEPEFGGHKIRRAESPAGFSVLWGETASANDYLTSRIARPNDYWLHVRGQVGSHVVVQTANNPSRVQKADIEFAARIAARHSGQRHAKHVPVDYTLAKYVRKPRKSEPGMATYTHEKTVFVDP